MNVLGLGKWTGFSATGSGGPAIDTEASPTATNDAVDTAWEAVKLWGLTNTGNTCYARLSI